MNTEYNIIFTLYLCPRWPVSSDRAVGFMQFLRLPFAPFPGLVITNFPNDEEITIGKYPIIWNNNKSLFEINLPEIIFDYKLSNGEWHYNDQELSWIMIEKIQEYKDRGWQLIKEIPNEGT